MNEALDSQMDSSANLLLTNDERICKLNLSFRNNNRPTNILSFPQFETNDLKLLLVGKIDTTSKINEIVIGDIAMSYETIARESNMFSVKFFDRCSHLFVHGMLHLLGMEHEDPLRAEEMERTEIKVLESFGLKNPYFL
jgi:probable rRNA maturation factor